jgi:hypothetical protein
VPETRLKREPSEPDNDVTNDSGRPISAFLTRAIEQICAAMSASGAVVAFRDLEGIRCVASAGDAPAVGSRLQSNSNFTRECIATGEVVLCEDTENDSRIQPSIARSLNLRSAVAVPIQVKGSVVGMIEVFSTRPSDIYATDVAVLKQFANLFAFMMAPATPSGTQTVARTTALLLAQAEARSLVEEQRIGQRNIGTNRCSAERVAASEPSLDSARLPVTRGFVPSAVPRKFESSDGNSIAARRGLREAVAHSSPRFAGETATVRIWRGRAASLFLLALLLFFSFFFIFRAFRPTAPDSPLPHAQARAKHDERWGQGRGKIRPGSQLEHKVPGAADPSSHAGVLH